VPNKPATISARCSAGRSRTACVASASIAINPPSPWLSARSTSSTYFSETTMVIVQKISDSTPSTLSRVTDT
jgi:hypothetical protein